MKTCVAAPSCAGPAPGASAAVRGVRGPCGAGAILAREKERERFFAFLLPHPCVDAPCGTSFRHTGTGPGIYPIQVGGHLPTPSLEREGGGRGCAGQCGHGARGTIPIDTHRRRRRARLGWLRPWYFGLDTQGVVCAPLPLHLDRRLIRLGSGWGFANPQPQPQPQPHPNPNPQPHLRRLLRRDGREPEARVS